MKRKKKKGFTLLELVLVVAIIGILSSIAVPKFAGILNESKIQADVATAKVIHNAATIQVVSGKLDTGQWSCDKGAIRDMLSQEPVNNFGYEYLVRVTDDYDVIVYGEKDGSKIEIYPTLDPDYGEEQKENRRKLW